MTPEELRRQLRREQLKALQAEAQAGSRNGWNIAEQAGTGASEGIASILGFPVDAVTGAINGASGLVGSDFRIENPVGGSASIERALSPFMADDGPQSTVERWAKRAGQEVGASAIPAGVAMRYARPASVLAAEATGLVAGETGAIASEQVANAAGASPQTRDTISEIVRSLGNIGAGSAVAARRQVPTAQSILDEGGDAINRAVAGGTTAPPTAAGDLADYLQDRLIREGRMSPAGRVQRDFEKAGGALSYLEDFRGQPITPTQMQALSQQFGDVSRAGGAEGRIGAIMREGFEQQVQNPNIPELARANAIYGRGKRGQIVEQLIDRAGRQASRSGTGGNTVNAIRQRADALLRQIEDGKVQGFTPEEVQKLRAVVEGNALTDTLRSAGFFAPSTGKLQAAIGAGAAGFTQNPYVIGGIALSEASKAAAEALTKRQINQLAEQVKTGRIPGMTEAQRAIVAAILAGQAPGSVPQQPTPTGTEAQ